MICAMLIGFKLYNERPVETKTVEVIKYIKEDSKLVNNLEPKRTSTIINGKLIPVIENKQTGKIEIIDQVKDDNEYEGFDTNRKLLNNEKKEQEQE